MITENLARRFEQAEIDMYLSRLMKVRSQPGNPAKVEIQQHSGAVATITSMPSASYNCIRGFSESALDALPEFQSMFASRNIPLRVELNPVFTTENVCRTLAGQGLLQTAFHSYLYMSIDDEGDQVQVASNQNIHVHLLRKEDVMTYATVYAKGFHLPTTENVVSSIAENNRVLFGQSDWRFYLGTFEGRPAAIAAMHSMNGIATLSAAATDPEYRGKGCQTALIRHRISEAKNLGCTYIVGQARFASVSQNNMERTGLKLAYTKSIWTV